MHNQPGAAPPVFVDRTGRRRRLTVIAGTAMGLGLLASLGLIGAGLFMDSSVPLPGWSENRPAAPLEAGVEGRDEFGGASPAGPRPSPATSTAVPVPTPTRSTAPATGSPTTRPQPQPSATDLPGQGDERRSTAKPTRSPGKSR